MSASRANPVNCDARPPRTFARESPGGSALEGRFKEQSTMQGTVYRRLFERLTDLIPQLTQPGEGVHFVALPRVAGDVASFCSVSNMSAAGCQLAISHGQPSETLPLPAPWMVLRVDLLAESAEVIAMAGPWQYDACSPTAPGQTRSQVNVFAVNSLTAMLNLGGAFRPMVAAAAVAA
jgi:hypothetical protein